MTLDLALALTMLEIDNNRSLMNVFNREVYPTFLDVKPSNEEIEDRLKGFAKYYNLTYYEVTE